MTTYAQWFDSLLTSLGITPNQPDLTGLASVVNEEGANTYNNPFNIESHGNTAWAGTGNYNSVGVQEYASPAAGVTATTAFLKANPGWDQLLTALKDENTAKINSAFTNVYTWATFRPASASQAKQILAEPLGNNAPPATDSSATSTSSTGGGLTVTDASNPINKAASAVFGGIGNDLLKVGIVIAGGALVVAGLATAAKPHLKTAALAALA